MIRRITEAVTRTVSASGDSTSLPVLALRQILYSWSHAEVVASDPILATQTSVSDMFRFSSAGRFYFAGWFIFVIFPEQVVARTGCQAAAHPCCAALATAERPRLVVFMA